MSPEVQHRLASAVWDVEEVDYDTWECAKCHTEFVDSEDHPEVLKATRGHILAEPRLYWLSPTEPVCHSCATKTGIPPVDDRD